MMMAKALMTRLSTPEVAEGGKQKLIERRQKLNPKTSNLTLAKLLLLQQTLNQEVSPDL